MIIVLPCSHNIFIPVLKGFRSFFDNSTACLVLCPLKALLYKLINLFLAFFTLNSKNHLRLFPYFIVFLPTLYGLCGLPSLKSNFLLSYDILYFLIPPPDFLVGIYVSFCKIYQNVSTSKSSSKSRLQNSTAFWSFRLLHLVISGVLMDVSLCFSYSSCS